MSKKRKRIRSNADQPSPGRIRSEQNRAILDGLIQFSFKFYDPDHANFHCRGRETIYFLTFLARLKDLSRLKISELIRSKPDSATRFHPIDFREDRVTADGFGIPGWEDADDDAWQFSLGVNENGRVHGFLIENVFYIVWLDAGHDLYGKR